MQESSITGNHFIDSAALGGAATIGSYLAVIASSDLAAWTTLIATVGGLIYQGSRLLVTARVKALEEATRRRQIEIDGRHRVSVLTAESAAQAAKIEAAGLRERLSRAEAEVDRLQAHIDKILSKAE